MIATNNGGVVYIGTKGSDVRILIETVIRYNHAGKKGRAISIVGSTLVVSNTNIYNNSAHLEGIISACNSDIKLHAYDNIVISRDPKFCFVSIMKKTPPLEAHCHHSLNYYLV